jgi:hypothetical protein
MPFGRQDGGLDPYPLDGNQFQPTNQPSQAEKAMRNPINHITKADFLPYFKAAYNDVITPSNIQGGFRGAGLVPFDPEQVISILDVKLRTPSPPLPTNNTPWQS